jgi:hypothetical protein
VTAPGRPSAKTFNKAGEVSSINLPEPPKKNEDEEKEPIKSMVPFLSLLLPCKIPVELILPFHYNRGHIYQYLRQLRKAEGGRRHMNTAQAGDLVENLGE